MYTITIISCFLFLFFFFAPPRLESCLHSMEGKLKCLGWDPKEKGPSGLLQVPTPALPLTHPARQSFILGLPSLPGFLRLTAHPEPRDSKPQHEGNNCQRAPRLFCHIHFAIWQVGVQNMLQEGEPEIFQKHTWHPKSLLNKCQPSSWLPSLRQAVLCPSGRGVPLERRQEKKSPLSVALEPSTWLHWLLWDLSRWPHNNSYISRIIKMTTVNRY